MSFIILSLLYVVYDQPRRRPTTTTINHKKDHQPSRRSTTKKTTIHHDNQPRRRLPTTTMINHDEDYRPSRQSTTKRTSNHHDDQPRQRLPTITTINHEEDFQLHHDDQPRRRLLTITNEWMVTQLNVAKDRDCSLLDYFSMLYTLIAIYLEYYYYCLDCISVYTWQQQSWAYRPATRVECTCPRSYNIENKSKYGQNNDDISNRRLTRIEILRTSP